MTYWTILDFSGRSHLNTFLTVYFLGFFNQVFKKVFSFKNLRYFYSTYFILFLHNKNNFLEYLVEKAKNVCSQRNRRDVRVTKNSGPFGHARIYTHVTTFGLVQTVTSVKNRVYLSYIRADLSFFFIVHRSKILPCIAMEIIA